MVCRPQNPRPRYIPKAHFALWDAADLRAASEWEPRLPMNENPHSKNVGRLPARGMTSGFG